MDICDICGGEIIFRNVGGQVLPIHTSGGCWSRSPSNVQGKHSPSNGAKESAPFPCSMRELAQQLGYALVFPVICRYCGKLIYLYAAPDGGFAVFDELGRPWSKHCCKGKPPELEFYYKRPSLCLKKYPLPVSSDTPFAEYGNGQIVTGVIVKVAEGRALSPTIRLYDIIVYTGRALYQCQIGESLKVGDCITGVASFIQSVGTVLQEVRKLLPPDGPT